jgi:hypothetical protein
MKPFCLAVAILSLAIATRADEAALPPGSPAERINATLAQGGFEKEIRDLSDALRGNPKDDTLRFGLGIVQFVDAVENLGQAWHRYGVLSRRDFAEAIPFLRLPVPENPNSQPVTRLQAREALERFVKEIGEAEKTLAGMRADNAALPLHFGRVRMDLDGDGQASDEEALWRVFFGLNRRRGGQPTEEMAAQGEGFLVKLDAGDACWLRAYCHLLSGILDFWLAHDDTQLFARTAHLFFAKPVTPYPFLGRPGGDAGPGGMPEMSVFMDAIAFIHLLNLPVTDVPRCRRARAHLLETVALSRKSWDLYLAETDGDHEWIPNPKQTGVIPDVRVTDEMVVQWRAFLDEAEALLNGKVLLPFWRDAGGKGVNLKRVFTEPQAFDLVLWVQGTAAAPYLEDGPVTKADFWERLMTTFGGNFFGFALWFN